MKTAASFNEPFASTNEREGSEIARQIVHALTDHGVRVFLVTHMFDLANSLYNAPSATGLFLRAERGNDGQRTFHMVVANPLSTSFGRDLYQLIFSGNTEPTAEQKSTPGGCVADTEEHQSSSAQG